MFRNRIYYRLKPHLPWTVRMGLRRWFAQRQRKNVREVWPILPGSERPPAAWSGWPDGRKFAFALTHDVEGVRGLEKVRILAELELRFGFRSCFNFIPDGDYTVPSELRSWLVNRGFEVGVHDFHHDGNLFSHRQEFARCVPKINSCLKEWNAIGFRSGFMLRKLNWLHDLDIQYDCSTFDTDPFEPQPDGVGTIFPYWISNPKHAPSSVHSRSSVHSTAGRPQSHDSFRTGYVELPYTLPQDSTLFLLLREQTSNIWLQKIDWISRHGGMAMVNVHPDYIRFNGEQPSRRTYPVEHYIQLLQYLQARFSGQFWAALPRDICMLWKQEVLRAASGTDSIVHGPSWNFVPIETPDQLRASDSVEPRVGHRGKCAAPSVI